MCTPPRSGGSGCRSGRYDVESEPDISGTRGAAHWKFLAGVPLASPAEWATAARTPPAPGLIVVGYWFCLNALKFVRRITTPENLASTRTRTSSGIGSDALTLVRFAENGGGHVKVAWLDDGW